MKKRSVGASELNLLDKILWGFARSIGYSSFTEAIYLARFWAAGALFMSSVTTYRLLWKHFEIVGGPVPGGTWVLAGWLAVLYLLIHLMSSSTEAFQEAELPSFERRLYKVLAWTLLVGLAVIVPVVVVWILA